MARILVANDQPELGYRVKALPLVQPAEAELRRAFADSLASPAE
jgi:hypothetical protein